MPNFPDNPEIPEMSSMRVEDIPYVVNEEMHNNPVPDMDMPRCWLLHDLAKVEHNRPFKDEMKDRYRIFKDLHEYFDSKSYKKCDILPVCGNCGSENTHRLQYAMTVCRGKWFVETENYCIDCGKYTCYEFKEPGHDFTGVGVQTEPFIGQIHPRAKKMLPIVNKKLQRWRNSFGPDHKWPEHGMVDVDPNDGKITVIEDATPGNYEVEDPELITIRPCSRD